MPAVDHCGLWLMDLTAHRPKKREVLPRMPAKQGWHPSRLSALVSFVFPGRCHRWRFMLSLYWERCRVDTKRRQSRWVARCQQPVISSFRLRIKRLDSATCDAAASVSVQATLPPTSCRSLARARCQSLRADADTFRHLFQHLVVCALDRQRPSPHAQQGHLILAPVTTRRIRSSCNELMSSSVVSQSRGLA